MKKFVADQKTDLPGLNQAWAAELRKKATEILPLSQDYEKSRKRYEDAGCGNPDELEKKDSGKWKNFVGVQICGALSHRILDTHAVYTAALDRTSVLSTPVTMPFENGGKKERMFFEWLADPEPGSPPPQTITQAVANKVYGSKIDNLTKSCDDGFEKFTEAERAQTANSELMGSFMSCTDLYGNPDASDQCEKRYDYAKHFCPIYIAEVGKDNTRKIIHARNQLETTAAMIAAAPLIVLMSPVIGGALVAYGGAATVAYDMGNTWYEYHKKDEQALRWQANMDFQAGRSSAGTYLMRSEAAKKDLGGFIEHELIDLGMGILAVEGLRNVPRIGVVRAALKRIKASTRLPEERAAFAADLLKGKIDLGDGKVVTLRPLETSRLMEGLRTAEIRYRALLAQQGKSVRALTDAELEYLDTEKATANLVRDERRGIKRADARDRALEREYEDLKTFKPMNPDPKADYSQMETARANRLKAIEQERQHVSRIRNHHRAKIKNLEERLFDAKLETMSTEERIKAIEERLKRDIARKQRVELAEKAGLPKKQVDLKRFGALDNGLEDSVELTHKRPRPE
ncbi:MAG: hypothetical protein ACXVCH_18260, partial [Bdellovibrionota bacterium]